jgi:hypothetical protein
MISFDESGADSEVSVGSRSNVNEKPGMLRLV